MTSSVSDLPPEGSGPIILNAQIVAAEGKADRVEELLRAIRKNALSDAEPGCSEYRPGRSYVKDGKIVFTVWEKYANPQAVKDHLASDVFKQFAEEGGKGLFAAPPDIKYFYEI